MSDDQTREQLLNELATLRQQVEGVVAEANLPSEQEKIRAIRLTSMTASCLIGKDIHRLFARNTKDVVWTADLDFHWTYLSPSVELLLGYPLSMCMTRSLPEYGVAKLGLVIRETFFRTMALLKEIRGFWMSKA